ncbi:hypothetical protein [Serinicoccus hydrothermalis]|uniref:hypothetical protein n=1 Tax=Serinicoccus hydrothermalis TaxID=1758689 RepID=UPI0012F7928E|nr:hypothetical protein [Serinicoccus hydrothermalis]
MTATNEHPAAKAPGIFEVTKRLKSWARDVSGDATAFAASRAITHHNWHAAESMPAPRHYESPAALDALEAVRTGVLPHEAFNNEAIGDLPRTTTGMQAAVTLRLLHDAGAPLELMSVLTAAYGVDIHDVQEVVERNRLEGTGSAGLQRGGRPYVEPSRGVEDGVVSGEPVLVPWNADAIDRGTKAHKDLEVEVAAHVRESGLLPLSPCGGDEPFDVAWVADSVLYVCEVKSLTDANQESQLRLGLGQLLAYLFRTKAEHWPDIDRMRGVLAVEGPPKRLDWVDIRAEHGVTLTWPGRFPEVCGEAAAQRNPSD